MKNLFSELKKRNVLHVAVVYAFAAWLIMQVVDVMFPAFQMPAWTVTFVAFLLVIGFPIALIFAWAFELTPEGIKRAETVPAGESITKQTGQKLTYVMIGMLSAAVLFYLLEAYYFEADGRPGDRGDLRSIAILPFENLSNDPLNDPFTLGIHDDLITHVSKIGAIKTISRTSVLPYRNSNRSVPEIAGELRVATVLEGGVQRIGDRVRINVQLIEASTDQHLWADTYDRKLTPANIFSIQSEIATAVARSLETTLSPEETQRINAVPTQSLEAYEAYLLGNQLMAKRTVRDIERASAKFEEAIGHDPEYALAWVGLANSYSLRGQYGGLSRTEIQEKAGQALERAFSLDESLAQAYAGRGLLALNFDNNEAAEKNLLRAIELEPNYAAAYHWYAELLKTDLGQPERAAEYFEKALTLDPFSAIINAATATNMQMMGRFEEAFALNERARSIDAAIPGAYWGDGSMYWAVRADLVKAAGMFRRMRHLDPRSPQYTNLLCQIYIDLGDIEAALRLADELAELSEDHLHANLCLLWLAAYQQDPESARRHAELALAINPRGELYASTASILHALNIAGLAQDEMLAFIGRSFGELLEKPLPTIDRRNYRAAIDLAGILGDQGDSDRPAALLAGGRKALRSIPRLGWFGYGIAEAEILALQDQAEAAVSTLEAAHKAGWRLRWWTLERNPNLSSIRNSPRVRRMLDTISADMANQLAQVKSEEASDPLR